jgi:hypothetical protein
VLKANVHFSPRSKFKWNGAALNDGAGVDLDLIQLKNDSIFYASCLKNKVWGRK